MGTGRQARGAQRRPSGQEGHRGRAQDLPRPAGAADPGRAARRSALFPSGPGQRRDPVPAGAAQSPRRRNSGAQGDSLSHRPVRYYSMFGFQRVSDLIWAFGDAETRGGAGS
ncbi:MAG: hypothetical protein HZA54_17890 [Planctomycetes bacterium]|nr:hypothetical protein [Planctomycetota bacterium]